MGSRVSFHSRARVGIAAALVLVATAVMGTATADAKRHFGDRMDRVDHIVVIYQENHSFDNLYGGWEGEGVEIEGERGERAQGRKKLLEWFATGDSRFSVEKLMEEAERLG